MKRGKRAYRKIILYALGIEMSSLFFVAFETKKGSATKKTVAVHEEEIMASRISSLLIIRLKNAAKNKAAGSRHTEPQAKTCSKGNNDSGTSFFFKNRSNNKTCNKEIAEY